MSGSTSPFFALNVDETVTIDDRTGSKTGSSSSFKSASSSDITMMRSNIQVHAKTVSGLTM